MVFQEGYLIVYTLKVTIYCPKHDSILICWEKKHLIFKKLEGYPNLAWAEYLPPWAFLDVFCKISTPVMHAFSPCEGHFLLSQKSSQHTVTKVIT